MLTVDDLCTLNTMPREKDITLQIMQEFYFNYLCNRSFAYKIDDPQIKEIELRFTEGNLCHLLGIHGIMKGSRKRSLYEGKSGYNLIQNGTITFEFLKKHNKILYKDYKKRLLYFPFIYQIVRNPSVIEYLPNGTTKIAVDNLLYAHFDNNYLHIGIERKNQTNYYHPKTYLHKKNKKFIEGSRQLNVISTDIRYDFTLVSEVN